MFLCAFLICESVLWGLSVWRTWWILFPQKLSVHCSLLSTENSLDLWGKWHEKKERFFSSVRKWKSGKGQASLSLFPFQFLRDAREIHAGSGQQHFLCGSRVETEGFALRDSSLSIKPRILSFFFTLSLQEKYTCIFVGKSRWVFVCEIEPLPGLFMASALLFPTKM